jgi:hypothetical protein
MLQFQGLPTEIFEHILDYFDNFPTYGAFPQVCKGFRDFLASLARRGDIYARHALYVLETLPEASYTDLGDVVADLEKGIFVGATYSCRVFDELHSVGGAFACIEPYDAVHTMRIWYRRGCIHRDDDQPAIIYNGNWDDAADLDYDSGARGILYDEDGDTLDANDLRTWYKDGLPYRANDLPTLVYACGRKEWRDGNDRRHRDGDAPALICPMTHNLSWYKHGELHRDNWLPAYVCLSGYCRWYSDGVLYMESSSVEINKISRTNVNVRPDVPAVNLYNFTNKSYVSRLVDRYIRSDDPDIDEWCVMYKNLHRLYFRDCDCDDYRGDCDLYADDPYVQAHCDDGQRCGFCCE